MKNMYVCICLAASLLLTGFIVNTAYSDAVEVEGSDLFYGDGTEESPWIIATEQDLRNIDKSDAFGTVRYFALVSDLTIKTNWVPIGDDKEQSFTGVIFGNGHTINYISQGSKNASLIKYLGITGSIEDLDIITNISGGSTVGAICSTCAGSINNCTVSGVVSASSTSTTIVGALVGHLGENGRIENCVNYATVTGSGINGKVGGIVGRVGTVGATIMNCINNGSLSVLKNGTGAATLTIGGIVGESTGPLLVENCISNCSILNHTGSDPIDDLIWYKHSGTIAGNTENSVTCTLKNCYGVTNSITQKDWKNTETRNNITGTYDNPPVLINTFNTSNLQTESYSEWGKEYWKVTSGSIPALRNPISVAVSANVYSHYAANEGISALCQVHFDNSTQKDRILSAFKSSKETSVTFTYYDIDRTITPSILYPELHAKLTVDLPIFTTDHSFTDDEIAVSGLYTDGLDISLSIDTIDIDIPRDSGKSAITLRVGPSSTSLECYVHDRSTHGILIFDTGGPFFSTCSKGESITVEARGMDGMDFDRWSASEDGGIKLSEDSSYTFVPDKDAALYAIYTEPGFDIFKYVPYAIAAIIGIFVILLILGRFA